MLLFNDRPKAFHPEEKYYHLFEIFCTRTCKMLGFVLLFLNSSNYLPSMNFHFFLCTFILTWNKWSQVMVSCHFVCILLQMMYNVVLTYLTLFVSFVRLWALKNAQYIALAKILFWKRGIDKYVLIFDFAYLFCFYK